MLNYVVLGTTYDDQQWLEIVVDACLVFSLIVFLLSAVVLLVVSWLQCCRFSWLSYGVVQRILNSLSPTVGIRAIFTVTQFSSFCSYILLWVVEIFLLY